MIKLILVAYALNFQCFVHHVQKASGVEIKKNFTFQHTRQTNPKQIKMFVKNVWNKGDPNPQVLAISWMESRLRPFVRRGDKGQACGTFQIHARHSYPMFRRKGGYVDWKPKEYTNKILINKECRKLEHLAYSLDTLNKYLALFKKHDKHPCHHNSGFYGTCNTWYKKRLAYWIDYFQLTKLLCKLPDYAKNAYKSVNK